MTVNANKKKKNTEGKKQEETKKGEVILPEKHLKWKGKVVCTRK